MNALKAGSGAVRTANRDRGRAVFAGVAGCLIAALSAAGAAGGDFGKGGTDCAVQASALLDVPVREVTVFKDGHAFVLHEGELPVSEAGEVVLTSLPTPVIGTFWPHVSAGGKLVGVVAGERKVLVEKAATAISVLLASNIGRTVIVQEIDGAAYEAEILGYPGPVAAPPSAESAPAAAPDADRPEHSREIAEHVLLRTFQGVRVVAVARIRDLTFREAPQTIRHVEEKRKVLTLRLDTAQKPAEKARVGMVYLQRGMRWIPNYRIDIDGAGRARVRLQATLLNEMVDFQDATMHLVIGVPSFALAETIDPIALQEAAAQLSRYFQSQGQQGAYQLSNMIQSQHIRMGEYRQPSAAVGDVGDGDEVAAGSRHEDLFVFTLKNITLRKGERMVVPVVEFDLAYEDIFALELPFSPPVEVCHQLNPGQQSELARLLSAPRVMHRLRMTNQSAYPLTTAPAIILQDDRLLAQSLMTYTAVGAKTDVDLMPAVDISVVRTESEVERNPSAARWRNYELAKIELEGRLKLVNRRTGPVNLEVARYVLGTAESAGQGGRMEKTHVLEDLRGVNLAPKAAWWGWYNWPEWWGRFNGVGKFTWEQTMEAGATLELTYRWSYYW